MHFCFSTLNTPVDALLDGTVVGWGGNIPLYLCRWWRTILRGRSSSFRFRGIEMDRTSISSSTPCSPLLSPSPLHVCDGFTLSLMGQVEPERILSFHSSIDCRSLSSSVRFAVRACADWATLCGLPTVVRRSGCRPWLWLRLCLGLDLWWRRRLVLLLLLRVRVWSWISSRLDTVVVFREQH